MKNEATVTITQDRYEQLLDMESRVHIIAQMIMNENYVSMEKILLYLGCLSQYETFKEKIRKEQQQNASINKRN